MRHAQWEVVGATDEIIFIKDLDQLGYPSITNDAEWVYEQVRNSTIHKKFRRVVYNDTDNTWWEIVKVAGDSPGNWRIAYKQWHGEVWDKLTKDYSNE